MTKAGRSGQQGGEGQPLATHNRSVGAQASATVSLDDTVTVPLVEEQAIVVKHRMQTGRVRVATRAESIEEVVRATLDGEVVDVTRVAFGHVVTGPAPQVRTEGDLTIVPVLEEVLVVEKRLVLKEELHIRRRPISETVEEPITLRRDVVEIERFGDGSGEVS